MLKSLSALHIAVNYDIEKIIMNFIKTTNN